MARPISAGFEKATSDQESVSLSDAATTAQAALAGALSFAEEKMRVSRAATTRALQQNDREAYGYFCYGLAQQVAEHLAALDEQVRAVYLYDDEATPEDEVFGEARPSPLLHMIVVVGRKTEALNALLSGLDRALVQGLSSVTSSPNLAHVLDTQVVEEKDVKSRSGCGALLSSVHHRPLPILQR